MFGVTVRRERLQLLKGFERTAISNQANTELSHYEQAVYNRGA
jgi:hypothetical protein